MWNRSVLQPSPTSNFIIFVRLLQASFEFFLGEKKETGNECQQFLIRDFGEWWAIRFLYVVPSSEAQ